MSRPAESLDVIGMSADVQDDRVVRLHFRNKVTDKDRADVLLAINLLRGQRQIEQEAVAQTD
jgi:hypothetical protein